MRTHMVLLLLAVFGCFTPARQITKEQSVAKIAPAEREAVFSRALATMQRRGWIVAVSDRAGGVLTSQTMDSGVRACGAITCSSRSTLQVTIAESGDVVVNLHREFYLGSPNNSWFTPGAEQDVRVIEAEQRAILAEVVGRAAGAQPAASR